MAQQQAGTPTEIAYDAAITALYNRHANLPGHTVQERSVKHAIAKLHNQLLDKSGMDGLHIPVRGE